MKNLLYKALALLAVVAISTSCLDDVLDVTPQSTFEPATVYSDYQLAEYTIFAIAHTFGDTNCYRGRINMWYGANTDVELHGTTSITSKPDVNKYTLPEYDVQTNNGQMSASNNAYTSLTAAIERANLAIEGMRQYANLNDPDMAYLLGEALTYRAFIYFELTKFWGDVPFRTKPVSADDIYLPKSDRDIIYTQILADLEEAIEYLYWPYESKQTSSMDRMNKAFAKGLYARIALTAAGYAWRPADGKVGTGDPGSLRLSVNENLSKAVLYPKALKHLEDIFASGTVALESDYETLWRKFNNSEHVTNSKEILWVVPMSDSRNRWNYHYAFPHRSSEYIANNSRGGDIGLMPTMWWKYEKQDVRRDLTCVPFWYNRDVTTGKGGIGYELRGGVNYWFFGKYRYEWMIDAPYTGGNDDGIKHISMRLSDVYLMAAELAAYQNELSKAQQYLLKVRERAYKGNESLAAAYVNSLTIGNAAGNDDAAISDYNAEGTIMKAIIDERGLELVGEQIRKQDLIRWGILKIKLDEAAKDLEDLAYMRGDYAAYAPYSTTKSVTINKVEAGTYQAYPLYWRQKEGGIEIFGLEADQIGQAPADYTETEPNGWYVQEDYISPKGFWIGDATATSWGVYTDYRWSSLYKNSFNDPYPRSVWPFFDVVLTSMQGAIVNDYGY